MSDQVPEHSHSADESPDWDAIARYLAGESPADERERVRTWLAANPDDRQLVERLDETARPSLADVDVEQALARVHTRMREQPSPRLTVSRGDASRWRRTFAIPALLAAAAVVAIVVTRRSPRLDQPASPVTSRTYATSIGQRDSITLSDGSRVILGPASRLEVASTYGGDTRSVVLEGDAYFDVRHDAAKPFSVHVGPAVVEDIGTTFTIESDAGDSTSVAVISGSVRLRANGSSPTAGAVLSAGDRGAMSREGAVRTYPQTVTADAAAWTSGRLVFHEASFARVSGEIRRWYGVTLVAADSSLVDHHLTAEFNGESVDQVLNIIGLDLGARIARRGDSATVTPIRGKTTTR